MARPKKESTVKATRTNKVEVAIVRRKREQATFEVYDAKTNKLIHDHPHLYARRDNAIAGAYEWCEKNKKHISLWLA